MPNENLLAQDLDHILTHTADLWYSMRGKNVFVTGGTGFFGRWLLESFYHANEQLGLGARLVVLSRDPQKFLIQAPHLSGLDSIRFVKGDVRDFTMSHLHEQLPGFGSSFPFLIHAATEASAKLSAEDPLLMFDTIVEGTRGALQFAAAAGTQRFLFISSGAVYGKQPSELTHIPESYGGAPDCANPNFAYGEGKRAAEMLAACFGKQHGIDVLIARCFAFVGPFLPLDAHFAIGNFIRDALRGGPILVTGDGTPYRSYLYAADLTVWLWDILFKGRSCRPYNVGSEESVTIAQLAAVVANAAVSCEIKMQLPSPATPQGPPARYVPDTEGTTRELGLRQRIPLLESIRRTMLYLKAARPASVYSLPRSEVKISDP